MSVASFEVIQESIAVLITALQTGGGSKTSAHIHFCETCMCIADR
jgi:hypothetical protein